MGRNKLAAVDASRMALELEHLLEGRAVRRRERVRQQSWDEAGASRRLEPLRRVRLTELGREAVGGLVNRGPEVGPALRQRAAAAVGEVEAPAHLVAEQRPQILVHVGMAGLAAEAAHGVEVIE